VNGQAWGKLDYVAPRLRIIDQFSSPTLTFVLNLYVVSFRVGISVMNGVDLLDDLLGQDKLGCSQVSAELS
jgi:hypothetical protein